jgi:hypothetical protein
MVTHKAVCCFSLDLVDVISLQLSSALHRQGKNLESTTNNRSCDSANRARRAEATSGDTEESSDNCSSDNCCNRKYDSTQRKHGTCHLWFTVIGLLLPNLHWYCRCELSLEPRHQYLWLKALQLVKFEKFQSIRELG